jgi:hypothetical protein
MPQSSAIPEEEDRELIRRVAEKDRRAFETLYQRYAQGDNLGRARHRPSDRRGGRQVPREFLEHPAPRFQRGMAEMRIVGDTDSGRWLVPAR